MKIKIDNKGVSLALAIGLMLLLVTMTVTVNELVIRALKASRQIESSDKAYFAAEAGIEDALYELSAHTAGYQTPDLDSADPDDVRSDVFSSADWSNRWDIRNKGLNSCLPNDWVAPFAPSYCGRIYQGDKLVINLFEDTNFVPSNNPNEINTASAITDNVGLNAFTIRFRLPKDVMANYPSLLALDINNDGDALVNEDGADSPGDDDNDGREDEDSEEDTVFIWRVIDSNGNFFQPHRGCKGDSIHSSHPGEANAGLCEKNFSHPAGEDEMYVELSFSDWGSYQVGGISDTGTLEDFLDEAVVNPQIEVLVAAPFEFMDGLDPIPIPYWEYGVEYTPTVGGTEIPSTYFSLRSDGYYRDFKQSITTNVVPRATSRLLDLTIIQQ